MILECFELFVPKIRSVNLIRKLDLFRQPQYLATVCLVTIIGIILAIEAVLSVRFN